MLPTDLEFDFLCAQVQARTHSLQILSPLLLQCPRSTGSWSPFYAPSWSPGPPSRSWSREESSGRGCLVAILENTCWTRDTMVRVDRKHKIKSGVIHFFWSFSTNDHYPGFIQSQNTTDVFQLVVSYFAFVKKKSIKTLAVLECPPQKKIVPRFSLCMKNTFSQFAPVMHGSCSNWLIFSWEHF